MKKLIIEEKNEGLTKLLGEKITLLCLNYIYTGKLIGVNDDCILLEDPSIVFETGCFKEKEYKNVQPLNVKEFYITKNCIEGFGILK